MFFCGDLLLSDPCRPGHNQVNDPAVEVPEGQPSSSLVVVASTLVPPFQLRPVYGELQREPAEGWDGPAVNPGGRRDEGCGAV